MRDFVDLTESRKSPLQMCRAQSGGWGLACIKLVVNMFFILHGKTKS